MPDCAEGYTAVSAAGGVGASRVLVLDVLPRDDQSLVQAAVLLLECGG